MKDQTIHATKDYTIFKGVTGNRKINKNHVAELTKSIAKKNMLAQNPIIVTSDMEVIDGQHRLEVAKANKFFIYYTVIDDSTSLENIQMLNAYARNWKGEDYLNSFVALGRKPYVILRDILKDYPMSLGNAILILSNRKNNRFAEFKRGNFKIERENYMDTVISYSELRKYANKRAWGDREFVMSFIKVLETISWDELKAKLQLFGMGLEAKRDQRDYLRQWEEVVNFRVKSNTVRLY